jgi:hypothetical protein
MPLNGSARLNCGSSATKRSSSGARISKARISGEIPITRNP